MFVGLPMKFAYVPLRPEPKTAQIQIIRDDEGLEEDTALPILLAGGSWCQASGSSRCCDHPDHRQTGQWHSQYRPGTDPRPLARRDPDWAPWRWEAQFNEPVVLIRLQALKPYRRFEFSGLQDEPLREARGCIRIDQDGLATGEVRHQPEVVDVLERAFEVGAHLAEQPGVLAVRGDVIRIPAPVERNVAAEANDIRAVGRGQGIAAGTCVHLGPEDRWTAGAAPEYWPRQWVRRYRRCRRRWRCRTALLLQFLLQRLDALFLRVEPLQQRVDLIGCRGRCLLCDGSTQRQAGRNSGEEPRTIAHEVSLLGLSEYGPILGTGSYIVSRAPVSQRL